MRAEKAKRVLLGVEIPRDELAVRIAEAAMGMKRPAGATAREALDHMARIQPEMVTGFRAAADRAVLYFHDCINAGKQPS